MKYKSQEMNIQRHKTALSRNNYSRPVQHLLKSELLTKQTTFFDYGCGKGDDVSALQALGFRASGWDPHFFLKEKKQSAEIVNLGFVLNVIEDQEERKSALRNAWNLSKKLLIISVISIWDRPENDLMPLSDGHVTSKGTFQKYYEPGELKAYVDNILEVDSLPVDPTQVICFRNEKDAQAYLNKSASQFARKKTYPVPLHPIRKTRISKAIETFRESDNDLWQKFLEETYLFATAPRIEDLHKIDILRSNGVKPIDFLDVLIEMIGTNEWENIVKRTKNHYLTRIALAMFRGKPKPSHFTDNDRRSIKTLFASFSGALEQSKKVLFSIGNPATIAQICEKCLVGFEDEQALYLHRSLVPQVDAVLQSYIGIGRLFYGELDDVDIFKIHKESSKLTLLIYDDFDNSDIPILQSRIKISFRERRIWYFDHRSDQQQLKNKSIYL